MSLTVDELCDKVRTVMTISEEEDSDDEDRRKVFSAVLESIRLDRLPDFSSALRKQIHQRHDSEAPPWTGTVTFGAPLFGSYHVLFPLNFSDGVRWLLKVPRSGTRASFDEDAMTALSSEALAMQLLKRETTIPIPEVFAFDATLNNELNCPYIVLDFIPGKPLYDLWFDQATPKDIVKTRRTRVLGQLAAAMVQLDKYGFDQGGSIIFDEHGYPSSIGPDSYADPVIMWERLQADNSDEAGISVNLGPYESPKSYYTSVLDCQQERNFLRRKGELEVLRLFVGWIPEPDDGRKKFVFCHPDFNFQNILVSEDGTLQGLIDWDGVAAVPRSVGNESYPSWLTRDWDPLMYAYNSEMDRGVEPKTLWEDSPETLAFYRATYESFMKRCLSQRHPQVSNSGSDSPVNLTRNSLVAENVYIAASDGRCRSDIVSKIFAEIDKILNEGHWGSGSKEVRDTESEEEEWDDRERLLPDDIARGLVEGTLDERRMSYIRRGFCALVGLNTETSGAQ